MGASIRKQIKTTGLLALLFAANGAWAAQVTDTLKKPVELKSPAPAPAVETQPPAVAAAPAGSATLTISQFTFTGNTVFPSSELAGLLGAYLNKPITLADVYAAADQVTAYYVSKGYSLASVNVPPQKISGGTVQLQVSEGVIGKISVEGSRQKPETVKGYLGSVKPGTIYHGSDLETGLRRLNELPGLSAKAVIRPGDAEGSTDLVVKTDQKTFAGGVAVDNYGTKPIGTWRYSANVSVNNPLGIEDQLNLSGLVSQQSLLKYGGIDYNLPVNYRGTRLDLSYNYADFKIPSAADGTSQTGKIALNQPLMRSKQDQLDVSAGVSRADSEAEISGGGAVLSGTSITLLELGATYNHAYQNSAVTQLTGSLATNFKRTDSAAEARPLLAKAENVGQIMRLEIDAQHLQPLAGGLFLLAHLDGVYSPDPLSNVTQFSIGGPQNVRGYPSSEVRGDSGLYGQLTLGRNFNLGTLRITPRLFGDTGKVFCAESAPDCTIQSRSSAGVGTDIAFSFLSAKIDYSRTIGPYPVSDGKDSGRVFGSLAASF